MKKDQPNFKSIKVFCNCGNEFVIMSTLNSLELRINVCFKCHPFYTGKKKLIDSAGMIEIFKRRFSM